MKHKGSLVAILACGLVALCVSSSMPARGASGDYTFPQTGFTVPAVFMNYWQSHGGLPIFGYPISAATTEGGYQVQYFERNRFEWHPENKGTANEVELGLLGTLLTANRTFPSADPIADTPDQKYFMQTGHRLSGVFYQYWNTHGGLALFGYPISEQMAETNPTDGKTYTVQYFQRNRFEYHPELAGTPYEVELGLLGRDYLSLVKGGAVTPNGAVKPTSDASHPAPPNTTGPPDPVVQGNFLQGPHIGYGVIVHMYYQDHKRILAAVKDIGFGWVKQQVQWSDTEPSPGNYQWGELDNIVNDCNAAGINLVLGVNRTPAWAVASGVEGVSLPDNPDDFGNFMQVLSARYAGRVKAYEIWNEENLGNETGPDHWHPEKYAQLLKSAFLGTRAGDPNAVVISGALTPTGVYNNDAVEDTWFLDQLYQWNNGEIRNYYDVLGIHPYGYWNPPDTMYPVKQPSDQTPATEYKNHGSFYFRRIEDQRAVMEKHGETQKQVWVTEFGWCSDQRPDGYGECINNSLQDQANYTVRAFQKAQQDYPFMGVMFLWNLNFSTFQPWYTGPAHFSILNPDWSPRPVYWALKNMPKP